MSQFVVYTKMLNNKFQEIWMKKVTACPKFLNRHFTAGQSEGTTKSKKIKVPEPLERTMKITIKFIVASRAWTIKFSSYLYHRQNYIVFMDERLEYTYRANMNMTYDSPARTKGSSTSKNHIFQRMQRLKRQSLAKAAGWSAYKRAVLSSQYSVKTTSASATRTACQSTSKGGRS